MLIFKRILAIFCFVFSCLFFAFGVIIFLDLGDVGSLVFGLITGVLLAWGGVALWEKRVEAINVSDD